MESESLALKGKMIVARFNKLFKDRPKDSLSSLDWGSFRYEEERFSIWAHSLSLHHRGHSSLDYRLRESEKLTAYVRDLLDDMYHALELCKRLCIESVQSLKTQF